MRKIIFTTLFFAVSLSVFSQRIIVFDSNNDTVVKTGRSVQDMNAVSWNMTAIGRGAILFEYERKLNDYLHVLGGAGVTIVDLTNEIYRLWKFDIYDSFFGSGNSVSAGFMGEVALKVFPKQSDDMDGFYLGPMYRFRNYNSKFNFDGGKYKQFSNFHDIALIIGWQGTTYFDLFYNTFVGFGYGFGFNRDYMQAIDEYGTNLGVQPFSYKQNVLLPIIGVTIGWVF